MIEADILIAGAGPAGASLAVSLARAGPWRVVLVDRGAPSRKFGETLPGAARPLLRDLGLLAGFEAEGHPKILGQASIWGSDRIERRDSIVDPHGPGWRLDRPRFERGLMRAAVRLGCRLIRPAAVTRLRRGGDDTWRAGLESTAGAIEEIRCHFVVDATGRRASLARRLGVRQARLDNLVCSMLLLPPAAATDLDDFSMLEAAPDGWYYGARLQEGARLVAHYTDFDLADPRMRDSAAYLGVVGDTTLMRRLVVDFRGAGRVTRVAAWSGRLASYAGPQWAAVGDAACCFDPLSSQGVFNALYGGLRLGSAIASDLQLGTGSGVSRYAEEMDSVWRAYLRNYHLYYSSETRWTTMPFWSRRANPAWAP